MMSWWSRIQVGRRAPAQASADSEYLRVIDSLIDGREFEQALALLDEARAVKPDDPAVHYRIGLVHTDTGRPADAVASFDRVLALAPDDFRAHNNRGSSLQVMGMYAEAELAFRLSIDLNPHTDLPRLNLGKLLEFMGRREEAAAIYREGAERAGNQSAFAHNLAALEGRTAERAPDAYVEATFNAFAPTFERQVRSLGYDAPDRIASMLGLPGHGGAGAVLDLGCGTGLVGAALGGDPRIVLTGVDLSERMLDQARARGIYKVLAHREVHAWLRDAPAASFDTVVAADVLIYIGDLTALFGEVARVMRPGGRFVFSIEECASGTYELLPTGRFAHSELYIRELAGPSFSVQGATPIIVRQEHGVPIEGRLCLLRKA